MTAKALSLLDEFVEQAQPVPMSGLSFPEIYEQRNGEWLPYVHTFEDIYDMMSQYQKERTNTPEVSALVVITTGWAAPLGENGEVEGAPSKHPKRMRCVLRTLIEQDGGLVSRVEIDKPQGVESMDDFGSASGSLSEAVNLLGVSVWGRGWTQRLLLDWATDKNNFPEEMRAGIAERINHLIGTVYADQESED